MNRLELLCAAVHAVYLARRVQDGTWSTAAPAVANAIQHLVYFWECGDAPLIDDPHFPAASLVAWNRQIARENAQDLQLKLEVITAMLRCYRDLRAILPAVTPA